MSLPVHLVPSLDGVTPGATVTVAGDEAHHAVAVRRLRVGESVVLTDGVGGTATGEVSGTGKRLLEVVVGDVTRSARPTPPMTVVQAIPKGDRGELAVEVLTEVGVDVIVPWAASRCVAVWRGDRAAKSLAKWRTTAREAAKQARRSWFPEVVDQVTLPALVDRVAQAGLAVVLHEAATLPLAELAMPLTGEVLVVVGPEGGIADDELAALREAGALSVRMGSEVLRTSTAGVAAVAALMARSPRWA